MDQVVRKGGFERIRGYSFPSISFPSLLCIWIATERACWFLWYWCRAWWLTTLLSLDGDIDSVVVRSFCWCVRVVSHKKEEKEKERKREREGEEHLSCTRDFQFITTDLPRQFDAAPTLDERRHMSIAATENAGWVSQRSIYLSHNYHLSRESMRRPNKINKLVRKHNGS